jgi:CBS domain containing-hemolysin-like protein
MEYSPILIGLSILFSALFSGMEIAFVSANKLRIELDRKQGSLSSNIIHLFISKPGQYIATMLVGNNIALVIYGIQMAVLLEPHLAIYFESELGILLSQTIISTAIILVTAEFLPKSIFRLHPNGFLNFFALPMFFFYVLFYPISKASAWVSLRFIRLLVGKGFRVNREAYIFGRIDLDHLVEEASSPDIKMEEQQEFRIFQNALEFSEVKVRECMIPRTDIDAIDVESTVAELRDKFIESNYSRLPVYSGNIDNVIGYVSSKDLFRKPQSIKSKLLRIEFVPETMLAHKLLAHFIKEHKSIAIVVDEFGGTAGLVTIEDIIEEIFGEINDEHDSTQFVEKQLGENEYLLSGRLEVEYLNEKYSLEIPVSDEYDTLAGFVLTMYQNIPTPNMVIVLDKFKIKVVKMVGTRIDLLNLSKLD